MLNLAVVGAAGTAYSLRNWLRLLLCARSRSICSVIFLLKLCSRSSNFISASFDLSAPKADWACGSPCSCTFCLALVNQVESFYWILTAASVMISLLVCRISSALGSVSTTLTSSLYRASKTLRCSASRALLFCLSYSESSSSLLLISL